MRVVSTVTGSTRGRIAGLLTAFVIMPAIVYAQSVTATWNPSPPSENVTSYDVCIGSSAGSCNIQTASVPGSQVTFPFVPAGGVMHYVTVRGINANGAGAYSSPVGFSIPGFAQPSNQTSQVGVAIAPLTLSVSDPDGGALTFTHMGLPVGLSINSATRQITGTPAAAGAYNVTLFVSDGLVTVSRSLTWIITGTGSVVIATVMRPAADFNGDGRADMWRYELHGSQGVWRIRVMGGEGPGSGSTYQWGASGDVPLPGDYDGDRRADLAVYRPSTGMWYILKSSANYVWSASGYGYMAYQWGQVGDIPLPADYDGDGRRDVAVYRPSDGVWWILKSSTNYVWNASGYGYMAYRWGNVGDIPVPADFDGDRRADVTVYRPSTGVWWILKSSTGFVWNATGYGYMSYQWGAGGDAPVPADYDGDGRSDIAVWRASGYLFTSRWNFTSWVSYYWP